MSSDPVVHEGLGETGTARAGQASRAVPAAIEVSHLTKVFGGRTAVSDVSFRVESGEVFGFLGPNGAGKTTTVRTLGALIAPSSGSAIVAGIPLNAKNGPAIRSRISVMPESPGLYLCLTVLENLECFAGLYELDDVRGRIGRALLSDPAVLFLDEPTSGLDPVATREVHDLLASLRERGVTIFLTTHRLEEAERLCHRVAILNTTLRLIGRPDELRQQLFSRSVDVRLRAPLDDPQAVLGAVPEVEGWEQTPSGYTLTVSDPDLAAPALVRALVAANADVLSLAESRHSLEDVYLELIDEDVEARSR